MRGPSSSRSPPRSASRVGPHSGAHGKLVRPAPRHAGRSRPSAVASGGLQRSDLSDKPWFVGRWNRAITSRRDQPSSNLGERSESLLAVDDGVERIIGALRRTGELDRTYVLFTSDNGYMQGEHRIPQGKMVPYDPSTQLPLLIRGPGIPRGRRTKALSGDVDLAPTIMQATPAEASPARRAHTASLRARRQGPPPAAVPAHDGRSERRRGARTPAREGRAGRSRGCPPGARSGPPAGSTSSTGAARASSTT